MELAVALFTSAAVMAWTLPDISFHSKKKIDNAAKLSIVLGTVCVLLSLWLNNIYAALLSVVLAYFFDKSVRKIEDRKRLEVLDSQIETALQIISSLYEATENLVDVLDKAADCVDKPLSDELKRTVADFYNGMPLKDALIGLAERVPSRDISIFVSGIIEAEKFGTNPGDVISTVVETINDRMIINEDLKNELRGQKVTIYALLALLPAMVCLAMVLFPQVKDILTQSFTGKMIVCGIIFVEYAVWALSSRSEQRWQL
ncbi:MAG: type II secretion system F family protein [Thermacetogeniaceae bacterium]